nr:hypothetical protein [Candidatus Krumholzibacteriota bacterium]
DPFSAGAILVPLYGIVVGLFALLSIDGRKKGSVKKYMVLSLFIMMIIISVLALNAKGLSYSKTGIPALIICALIAHKMSTMVHS